MDEKREVQLRRKAIRWDLQGKPLSDILRSVSRGRSWFYKWRQGYQRRGWAGLHSQPRQPHRIPGQYSARVRQLVLRVRRRLRQRKVGLIGAKAIRRELRQARLLRQLPSESTIKRILREAEGTRRPRRKTKPAYYPKPRPTAAYVIQSLDWTERYLTGGAKVYAFHGLDLQTYACTQTISADKTYLTARAHVLKTWQTQGIPDALQMDNDSAFSGGNKTPRRFSQFVRLCLYVGTEPIFIPVGEAERNSEVERVNGLWGQAFWQRRHFTSLAQVQRASPEFEAWYMREYEPPKLQGQTPAQAQRRVTRRCLTERECRRLPEKLPITAGRIHFIRRVAADGTIRILNETWRVGKRLAGQYVWATLWTERQRLDVYHRRSAADTARLVKTYRYAISEAVVPLRPKFKHRRRRRKLSTMS